ncbi:MAG TPA: glycosyltransferase [Burkholderiales bacterium]|nr:glycosyltransferase [Burkholderiales bacterium]
MPPSVSKPASRLTLVIVARDEARALLQAVGRALALPERPAVIVVDNGSEDDGAREAKERHPQVKLVRLPFDMGAAAFNVGVERAETAYVAVCDATTLWAEGSLAAAADLLDFYPRVAALAARVLRAPGGTEDPGSASLAKMPLRSRGLPGREVLGLDPRAAVLRRAAFLEHGGFEPRFHRGGDALLAYDLAAAGWSLVHAPAVVAYRPASSSEAPQSSVRNEILTAWLRRPLPAALRRTFKVLAAGGSWSALRDALRDARWVLRNRRVIPAQVEARCRRLDAAA